MNQNQKLEINDQKEELEIFNVVNKKPDFKSMKLPRSSLLQRVKNFIPEIEEANKNLPKEPSKIDEENEETEGPYIEMKLALGILEEKKKKKLVTETTESKEEETDNMEEEEIEKEESNQLRKKILTPQERELLDKAQADDDVALLNIINSVYNDQEVDEEANSL
eukprot:gene3776-6664_t